MDFSSLVLMDKNKETGVFDKELGSYKVGEGAAYITKMFSEDNIVHIYFDTNKDVEEWEFTAIFDVFDEDKFNSEGFAIEQIDDEFNPTWVVKFKYDEDYGVISDKIGRLCDIIESTVEQAFKDIEGKQGEY